MSEESNKDDGGNNGKACVAEGSNLLLEALTLLKDVEAFSSKDSQMSGSDSESNDGKIEEDSASRRIRADVRKILKEHDAPTLIKELEDLLAEKKSDD